MSATFYFTIPTEETYDYFQVGAWYKSLKQNIIAKFSGSPEKNEGYWGSGNFPDPNVRMITPDEWVMITEKEAINYIY